MRLIDADAYLESVRPRGLSDATWKESHIYKSITNAPTVEERPHGEWKYNPDCVNDEMQAEFFCSICNHGAYSRLDNFCPNCGASMRKLIHGCSFASEECKKNPFADCGVKEGEEK